MKKSKLKSLVKSARKTAEKDIRLSLKNSLNDIAAQFGGASKKLNKDIEKGSKQLSKKLARNIKIDKTSFIKKEDAAIIETDSQPLIAEATTETYQETPAKTKKIKAVKTEVVPAETEKA